MIGDIVNSDTRSEDINLETIDRNIDCLLFYKSCIDFFPEYAYN